MRHLLYAFGRTLLTTMLAIHIALVGAANAEQFSNPYQLTAQAIEMFPEDLAAAVQEELGKAIQAEPEVDISNDESLATLFLADRFYNKLGTGQFVGAPTVTWDTYDDVNGRPTFVYAGSGFSYITSEGRRITPGPMDTDGGSIPLPLHAINRFSPWAYGPVFIVHDWFFVARKCNVEPDTDFTFDDSSILMAEAIKTLMEVGFENQDGEIKKFPKNEDTLYLMYLAVSSSIARDAWDNPDTVRCRD